MQAAINSQRKEYFSQKLGLITQTTITERSFKETPLYSTFAAGGAKSFNVAGGAEATLYTYAGVDAPNAADIYPQELLAIAGLSLLKQQLADEYFYDKQVALSPAFKALVTIVVMNFVVPNLGLSAVFSGLSLTAAEAFTASAIVGSIDGLVSGDFDIGDILKDAAFAEASAGIASGINLEFAQTVPY